MTKHVDDRMDTGVRNLDALLKGGVPRGSVTVIGGSPGSGKTITTQQICFHNATPENPVLYFSTLSEPTAKTLRYLKPFSFFDRSKLDTAIRFVDLGVILRAKGLEEASQLIMAEVKKVKPSIVVIDSFKVFDDLAKSKEELRKFGYELAVNLMAWEATTFLLGEYGPDDLATNPLFSIVDALVLMSQREESGEQQRFIQVVKMRGTDHSRDVHPFVITSSGIEVFAPRVTISREDRGPAERLHTGIGKLDDLIGEGIPRGSSLLIAGVAGTGKTALLLEFVYRGALAGEKGIIFTFEETEERLRASARGLGWDLDAEIERGMIDIHFIPQPAIMVECDLLMMRERIESFGARRVGIDSVSVFMHKIRDPQVAREKVFQLASIIQNIQAVGFFATDVPYGSALLSRFGVEETVVDGVILLSSVEEGMERHRYLEVYKLRNTAHLKGRHDMTIGKGGISVFPRYTAEAELALSPPALEPLKRLTSGVVGLDDLLHGGLIERSATLVSGSPGIGKSTLGMQFIAEGARLGQPGLYITLEEGAAQIRRAAEDLGLAFDAPGVDVLYLAREHVQANQYLAILADRIAATGARRVVLDGASQITTDASDPDELRRLLFTLVMRFKTLGVTTLVTLESKSLYATDQITDHGFSPIADNIIVLRYARVENERRPTISVVKSRGSAHDRSTHEYTIAAGGIHVGENAPTSPLSPGQKLRT